MFDLWENELTTKEQIQNKLNEIKGEYKEYKRLVNNYNWNNKVVQENITLFEMIISSFEDALKEF